MTKNTPTEEWTKPTRKKIAIYTRKEHELRVRVLKGVRVLQKAVNGLQYFIEKDRCDFFRETAEFTVNVPALPRPTLAHLRAKFDQVDSIERDTSATDALTLTLGTVRHPSEEAISVDEYEIRIAPKSGASLGYQHALWIEENQDQFLELKKLVGKIYIIFSGFVMVRSNSSRNSPELMGGTERWKFVWHWLVGDFTPAGRIAIEKQNRLLLVD